MHLSFHEIDETFSSFSAWLVWLKSNQWVIEQDYIRRLVEDIRETGIYDPVLGHIAPGNVEIAGTNYRETITAKGCNSRLRALLLELLEARCTYGAGARVFAPEAITPFACRISHLFFPGFVGSEFLPSENEKKKFPHLRHEDIQALSFPPDSFDIYFSCEVFEHIPSIPAALAEARRVLVPGGAFLVMCPFAYGQEQSHVRATRREDGSIFHNREPEYHGNPVDPRGGSLVFTIPGWEILNQCKPAGFDNATIKVHSSRRFGITGAETACVFVLKAS